MTIPVEVQWPPALFTSIDGKRYAISGNVWVEVPLDTTQDNVHVYMVVKKRETTEADSDSSWEVLGSKGTKYTVSLRSGSWSCTCAGFGWRRKCKHIKEKKAA